MIYLGLGDKDRALDYLEKALRERDGEMILWARVKAFEPLWTTDRFVEIFRKTGLPLPKS
jgi:hypothetical protein